MAIQVKNSSGKVLVLNVDEDETVYSVPVEENESFVEISFPLPVVNIQCHWNGKMMQGPEERLPWRIEQSFSFQDGCCFAAFFPRYGWGGTAFGLLDFPGDVFYSALMNQESGNYDVKWKVCFEEGYPKPKQIRFYYAWIVKSWMDSLAEWRNLCRKEPISYPATAFDPVFCTWYAIHAAVTEEWCEAIAPKVRELGFKTFILDDGWCYDDSKRVTPETLKNWYEWIGDWKFSQKKFPHFKEHVKKLQKLGLNYMVWVAPFLIGAKSALYAQLEAADALQGKLWEGHRLLNPEKPEAAEAMLDTLTRLMKDTGVDGLKVDFLDEVKSVEGTLRGEACRHFITELSARIRAVKTDALMEFRQNYATMQMAPLATQFRAGDVPFDFMLNFKRLAAIRLCMGDGIPVHADPAYWHPQESPEMISCHCIAMLLGVPMLSMDVNAMSEDAKKIVRRWLAFYEEHRDTLNFGHWELGYVNGQLRYAGVNKGEERIVILADGLALDDSLSPQETKYGLGDIKKGYILNLACDGPLMDLSDLLHDCEDCFGNSDNYLDVGGLARFEI